MISPTLHDALDALSPEGRASRDRMVAIAVLALYNLTSIFPTSPTRRMRDDSARHLRRELRRGAPDSCIRVQVSTARWNEADLRGEPRDKDHTLWARQVDQFEATWLRWIVAGYGCTCPDLLDPQCRTISGAHHSWASSDGFRCPMWWGRPEQTNDHPERPGASS